MGIETAAALAAAAEAAAAGGAAAAGAAGTAAATAGTALGAAETAAAVGGAAAAEAGGATLAAGSMEFANAVGSIGGDALGALVSANQGFGTMTAMESMQGMLASVQSSPLVEGLQAANSAANAEPEQPAKPYGGPTAGDPGRVNQNAALTQQSSLMQQSNNEEDELASLNTIGYQDGGRVPLSDFLSSFMSKVGG